MSDPKSCGNCGIKRPKPKNCTKCAFDITTLPYWRPKQLEKEQPQ
jgi:hypothetical protein